MHYRSAVKVVLGMGDGNDSVFLIEDNWLVSDRLKNHNQLESYVFFIVDLAVTI
jgi:hypothetical protein